MKTVTALLLLVSIGVLSFGQGPQSDRQQFIRVDAPVIALTNVRVIDGTGAPGREDQTIVIRNGKIDWIGAAADAKVTGDVKIVDLKGYTVLPGLVGMHDHRWGLGERMNSFTDI